MFNKVRDGIIAIKKRKFFDLDLQFVLLILAGINIISAKLNIRITCNNFIYFIFIFILPNFVASYVILLSKITKKIKHIRTSNQIRRYVIQMINKLSILIHIINYGKLLFI